MSVIIFIMICFLTILPITIIIHEFGHFFCALACNVKKIKVSLGIGKKIGHLKYKELMFVIHILPLGGKTHYEMHTNNRLSQVIISIGGPFLNGIVAFLLLMQGIGSGEQYITLWFQWLAVFNLWMFVVNSIPFKIGKYYSDGWAAFYTIKTSKI
jgi:Zn-dependent protease